ncbi:MAG: TIGR00303 family protein [Synergistaceae bacterium]|nr:TIGR00303 family protein [Synergistaceae bacterium]
MFILFISETDLSREKGLSAAGANVEALPYTAPADADMLYYDRPRVIDCIPIDPFGHPTPALVTKAAILEGGLPVMNIRAGTSIAPVAPFKGLGALPGKDPRIVAAVPDFSKISDKAGEAAKDLAGSGIKKFVLAESIPGGTTTALLLLRSLGYNGTVSSAGPINPLPKKEEIWNVVASRLGIKAGGMKGMGLAAAAEVGDPMQIAVASFVSALPEDAEVVLAGGTQMMAVAALLRDMKVTRPLMVATTKYICQDSTSCFVEYAEKIGVEWYSAPLDFSASKFPGLADYEKGYVKEGVGMGGAVWYALQNGAKIERITERTEKLYAALTS